MDAVEQLNSSLSGRYAIEREIGAGGMATVYLARDIRHDRRVALKVLNPELGAVLGVERFLSEIRVTANLQHPNLLPLFDSGEADGLLFYVMPFVEGETLRARLDREKQLSIDDAVRIAVAVAGALEYAHGHGVVHRDLKPENILMQAGQPVVADFGIALAVSKAGGNRVTQSGLSLGTPQYMSPEQATGDRAIDGRSDIYSLAAVLYEMLSGDPPYSGSTAQAIIARLLTERPRSLLTVRDTVPPHVDASIQRALAKLPADRFATAREFAESLQGVRPVQTSSSAGAPATLSTPSESRVSRVPPRVAVAVPWGIAAVTAGLLAWQRARPTDAPGQRVRFAIVEADSQSLREDAGGANITLSADGSEFVYVGGARSAVYSRHLNDLDARLIRANTEGASQPRFSPDGKWLAFVLHGHLQKMPVSGGPLVSVTDSAVRYSWGDRDQIVFVRNGVSANDGLWLVSAGGGATDHLTQTDSTTGIVGHTWPEFLPGGHAVVFVISRGTIAADELAVVSLDDRVVHKLGIVGTNPRYVKTGHLLFGRLDGTVSAVPFDVRRLRVTGPAVTVLDEVYVKPGGAVEIAVSPNGTLAYVNGRRAGQLRLVDTTGASGVLMATEGDYTHPRFSPAGDRIAYAARESGSTNSDIWVYSVAAKSATRLTNDGKSADPEWTPDGRRVSWTFRDSSTTTIKWQSWDGGTAAEALASAPATFGGSVWAPSGKFFLSVDGRQGAGRISLTPLDSQPRPLVSGVGSRTNPAISRDGQWLAYASTESRVGEIFVQQMNDGGRHQISVTGGAAPRWAPDGRTLYYRGGNKIIAARLVLSPQFVVARRDTLFDSYIGPPAPFPNYDISPDGKQFLMIGISDQRQRAIIVLNWLDELRERMALGPKK